MKICIIATSGESLLNFRGKMIQEWVKRGNKVVCVSVEPPSEMSYAIEKLGASYHQVAGDRTGIGIVSGIKMISMYKQCFREIKPDLCFLYMSKPIAFGGLAAIMCHVPRMIVFQTGLEIAFYSPGLKNLFIRTVLKTLYGMVQRKCETVFFMSHEDEMKMLKWKLVRPEQVAYVDGSGVDMEWFSREPMPEKPVVVMTARLVWSKGIREYIEAARIVKGRYPNVRFLLIGGLDENAESLSKSELDEVVNQGIIEYCGFVCDVRPFLKQCSVFALPSYHEGKGKSILEAQAVGRPIVTTTAPGCGETVIDGYNGFLVPPKDGKMLAEKIIDLVENQNLREQMAENAYEFCRKTFDVNIINKTILTRMGIAW